MHHGEIMSDLRIIAFTFAALIASLPIGGTRVQPTCLTPLNRPGICILARDCQPLFQLMIDSREEHVNFLLKSQCGTHLDNNPKVCCPLEENVPEADSPGFVLPLECGIVASNQNPQSLRDFKWTALLEFRDGVRSHPMLFGCNGFLISKRYVLTAAHCLSGHIVPKFYKLTGVRLGEHNLETDLDCDYDTFNTSSCVNSRATYEIEEQIIHENFHPRNGEHTPNDIALIRLSKDVQFTDYISPVCLPEDSFLSSRLLMAGWGSTFDGKRASMRRKLILSLIPQESCADNYLKLTHTTLSEDQFCAGGDPGMETCRGDSGAGLVDISINQNGQPKYRAVGINSFGSGSCGTNGWPDVYTKVSNYALWILTNIRP